MRNLRRTGVLKAILMVFIICFSSSAVQAYDTYSSTLSRFPNPGFEAWVANGATAWKPTAWTANGQLLMEGTNKHSGNYAAKWISQGQYSGLRNTYKVATDNALSQAAIYVNVSLWAKSLDASGALSVELYTDVSPSTPFYSSSFTPSTSSFTQQQYNNIAVPAGANEVRLTIKDYASLGARTYYIDDAIIYPSEAVQVLGDPGFEMWDANNPSLPLFWRATNDTNPPDLNNKIPDSKVVTIENSGANPDIHGGDYALQWLSAGQYGSVKATSVIDDFGRSTSGFKQSFNVELYAKSKDDSASINVELWENVNGTDVNSLYSQSYTLNNDGWTTITINGINLRDDTCSTRTLNFYIKDMSSSGSHLYYFDDASIEQISAPAPQYIKNNGLESWTSGAPNNWVVTTGHATQYSADKHGGSYCLKWTSTANGEVVRQDLDRLNLTPGISKNIALEYYVKRGDANGHLQVDLTDENGKSLYSRGITPSSSVWTFYQETIPVPVDVSKLSLTVKDTATSGNRIYYLDDFKMTFLPVNIDAAIDLDVNTNTHDILGIGWNTSPTVLHSTGGALNANVVANLDDAGMQYSRMWTDVSNYQTVDYPTGPDWNKADYLGMARFAQYAANNNIVLHASFGSTGGKYDDNTTVNYTLDPDRLYDPSYATHERYFDYFWLSKCCNVDLGNANGTWVKIVKLDPNDSTTWTPTGPHTDLPYSTSVAARSMADFVRQINTNYSGIIKYLGVWNEPYYVNSQLCSPYPRVPGDPVYPACFAQLYADCRTWLNADNQSSVKVMGCEEVCDGGGNNDGFAASMDSQDSSIDSVSMHVYGEHHKTILSRMKNLLRNSFYTHNPDNTIEPILANEVDWDVDGTQSAYNVLESSFITTRLVVGLLKEGAYAVNRYTYCGDGDLKYATENGGETVHPVAFNPMRLLGKPIPSSSTSRKAVRTDVHYPYANRYQVKMWDGDSDVRGYIDKLNSSGYLDAATIKYTDGGQTYTLIWIVNDSLLPRYTKVNLKNLSISGSKTFYKYYIDIETAYPNATIQTGTAVTASPTSKYFFDTLPKRSIVVYTDNPTGFFN